MNVCAEALSQAVDVAVSGGKTSALQAREVIWSLQVSYDKHATETGSGQLPEAVSHNPFQTLYSSCWADVLLSAPTGCLRLVPLSSGSPV